MACACCKFQRRRCPPDCPLAPYFPAERQQDFLNAQKLFGVNKITKIIQETAPAKREDAMATLIFEANARAADPVGGAARIVQVLDNSLKCSLTERNIVLNALAERRAQAAYEDYVKKMQMHFYGPGPANNSVQEPGPELDDQLAILRAQSDEAYARRLQMELDRRPAKFVQDGVTLGRRPSLEIDYHNLEKPKKIRLSEPEVTAGAEGQYWEFMNQYKSKKIVGDSEQDDVAPETTAGGENLAGYGQYWEFMNQSTAKIGDGEPGFSDGGENVVFGQSELAQSSMNEVPNHEDNKDPKKPRFGP